MLVYYMGIVLFCKPVMDVCSEEDASQVLLGLECADESPSFVSSAASNSSFSSGGTSTRRRWGFRQIYDDFGNEATFERLEDAEV